MEILNKPENKISEKPEKILVTIKFDHSIVNVVDFGCGYGTFTIPASKTIKGKNICD